MGDVNIGDVIGRDLNKSLGAMIYGARVVGKAFTPALRRRYPR